MEMEPGRPSSQKRTTAAEPLNAREEPTLNGEEGGEGGDGDRIGNLPDGVLVVNRDTSRKRKLAAPAAAEAPNTGAGTQGQGPPLSGADGGAGDRISHLPNGVLGDIISLLPTKEGARTQIFASRWRHLWRSAPLNLDHNWLCNDERALDTVVSRILSTHPGPGRRFCAPVYHLKSNQADAWLRSPALDNLYELELCSFEHRLPYPPPTPLPPPAAAFRFSETLCVATMGDCHLQDGTTQALHFPKRSRLNGSAYPNPRSSLHSMIAGCPALECLLIQNSSGFCCLRINSISIRSIGCNNSVYHRGLRFGELIIENAPCLERLLQLGSDQPHTSVISAPKLETLACLFCYSSTRLAFDSTVIQGLRVDSLTTLVHTVKILAVDLHALSLDVVIDLMRCFPCLERLYIESLGPGKTNFWRRKHRDFIATFDIRLKTISWRYYRGIKSHVDFATFFVLNARMLELMTVTVNQEDYNDEFFARQRKMVQLDSKASRCALFHFTPNLSHCSASFFRVHDLDLADPFERKDHYQFSALS
ncbi:unnamed protein product [Alopecurus aequalis]